MAKQIETKVLIKHLANATKTYYGAAGHGKAARNERLAKEHRLALELRNADIPPIEKLLEIGEFNGEGSN